MKAGCSVCKVGADQAVKINAAKIMEFIGCIRELITILKVGHIRTRCRLSSRLVGR
jgi:hypothetical protein